MEAREARLMWEAAEGQPGFDRVILAYSLIREMHVPNHQSPEGDFAQKLLNWIYDAPKGR